MKSIYKYALHKYMKSYSTWIIMFFSAVVIGFIIGGMFAFIFNDITKRNAATNYIKGALAAVAGVTVFFGIFSAVFSGFKAAQLFKDEVENGTLLVIISKPIKRIQIILGKWLALQTILIMYAAVSVFFLCVGVSIFDNGNKIPGVHEIGVKSLRSTIWQSGIFILIIVYISSLIFSSIGILLSTKLSSTATVGIVIAIGVYIPISGLLGLLMRKPEASSVSFPQTNLMAFTRTVNTELNKLPTLPGDLSTLGEDVKAFEKVATQPSSSLYNLAFVTDDKDKYQNAWWADLDYQFKLLSTFAYQNAVPKIVIDQISSNSNEMLLTPSKINVSHKVQADAMYQDIKAFSNSFFKIQDRLAKLTTYNLFLGIQPVTQQDVLNFAKTNMSIFQNPLQALAAASSLQNELKTGSSIDELTAMFNNNKSLFKDPEQAKIQFIQYIMNPALRTGADNEDSVSDDFKVVVNKAVINELDDNIAKYQAYMSDPNHPGSSSVEMSDLISLFKYETNPNNAEFAGSNPDEQLLDIKFVKMLFNTIYAKSLDSTVNGVKTPFYVQDVRSARVENALTKAYDENWVRCKFIDLFVENSLSSALTTSGKNNLAKIVRTFSSSIASIASPLSILSLNRASLSRNTPEGMTIKTISEIRATIEDTNYDPNKPFDPTKRETDVISNLSEADSEAVRSVISGAMAKQAVSYTSKPYANKDWVLATYIIIAVALVPISYLVIRRQDFR